MFSKNNRARLPVGLLAFSVAHLAPQLAAAQGGEGKLRLRIEELQAQVAQLAEQAELETPLTAQQKGKTRISIGGFIKLDSQFSDYTDGRSATSAIGEDFLVPSTIPVGGEDGDTKFHAQAKTSRLFIKSRSTLAGSEVRTHLEIDAVASGQGDERTSNSYAQRLRHAYVDWQVDAHNGLLAGQSWSTFFNVGALPESLDFVGPVGTVFERQPQLRYTYKTGSGSLQLAAENPASTLYDPLNIAGSKNPFDDNGTPDLVLRYNTSAGNFHYAVASLSRELAYDNGERRESERGHAISVSGRYQLDRGDIRFMLSSGNALGRYMGLNGFRAGIVGADGDIELIDQSGGFVALRHFWNEGWRSNLVLSASRADNPDTVPDTTASAYRSLQLNLLYSPAPEMTLGCEYILAAKEVENARGNLADDEGKLQRLQFSVKYTF